MLISISVIRDRQSCIGTVYERYNEGGEILRKSGVVGFIKYYNEQWFFVLHDIQGNLIDDANYYLNNTEAGASYKKRELAFSALKIFFSFVELFHIDDYKKGLSIENVRKLIRFLEGGRLIGVSWDLDISVRRSNSTINLYMNVYRTFIKSMYRVDDSPLFNKSVIGIHSGNGLLGHANKKVVERFNENKKVLRDRTTVPKYIKEQEYKRIMIELKENYSVREIAIVELMYRYGLRLGEVLGLTFEDIVQSDNGHSLVIIRNRVLDKPYQSAKGVISVNNSQSYNSTSYTTLGIGYQVVLIDKELRDIIDEYIYETRNPLLLAKSPKKQENIRTKARAERVGTAQLISNENQYIFLSNLHYSPLSASGWNYVLRKVFKAVGIVMDSDVRRNNLSHRFRHGFAMNKVSEGYTAERLAKALRHSSTATCIVYYNPDEEDLAELLVTNDKINKERYNFE